MALPLVASRVRDGLHPTAATGYRSQQSWKNSAPDQAELPEAASHRRWGGRHARAYFLHLNRSDCMRPTVSCIPSRDALRSGMPKTIENRHTWPAPRRAGVLTDEARLPRSTMGDVRIPITSRATLSGHDATASLRQGIRIALPGPQPRPRSGPASVVGWSSSQRTSGAISLPRQRLNFFLGKDYESSIAIGLASTRRVHHGHDARRGPPEQAIVPG